LDHKWQTLRLSGPLVPEAIDHTVNQVAHGGAQVAHFAAADEIAGAVVDGGAGFVVVADARQLDGEVELSESLAQSGGPSEGAHDLPAE